MTIDSILQPVMALFPTGWSGELRLGVLAGVATGLLTALVLIATAIFRRKPKAPLASVSAASVPAPPANADLDPEEWISGNVIHYDRQRAFGYIRCDRVKGHVRFQAAGFKRAPRVGETVRFKGRHGARRKPVAVIVERLPGAKRTG